MQINPKVGFIAAAIHGCLQGLVLLGWATVFDAHTAAIITLSLAGVDTIVQAIVNGFSSSDKGIFNQTKDTSK